MYDAKFYVRVFGFKVALLAVAFGAIAANVPAPGAPDTSLAEASWYGMKLAHLIIGTAAAGASLFFLPSFSGVALGRTIASGMLCSAVGTPFFAWALTAALRKYLGMDGPPPVLEPLLAAALGIGGVYIIPTGQRAWEALRDDPLGAIGRLLDRVRGRGGQP